MSKDNKWGQQRGECKQPTFEFYEVAWERKSKCAASTGQPCIDKFNMKTSKLDATAKEKEQLQTD